jgi:tRNA threonylcarbamoyladenosine biosynthesis protein TsaB
MRKNFDPPNYNKHYLCPMTKILHIDTAGQFCSLALSENHQLMHFVETDEKNAHARLITIFIDQLIKSQNLSPEDLDAVAVSSGPGSYTGLRIGVSAAKGLCYALGIPLLAIPSLQSMAIGMIEATKKHKTFSTETLFCPMIDARRMEVYAALFDQEGKAVRETSAEIIDENSFAEDLNARPIVFAGSGAAKCTTLLSGNSNALFLDNFESSAKYMIPLAMDRFLQKQWEDVAYFEPFYLKEFKAGAPKVKGLR